MLTLSFDLRAAHRRARRAVLGAGLALGALAVPGTRAAAQIEPVGFAATIRTDSVYYLGDVLHVVHTVTDGPTSAQKLWGFTLEARVPQPVQNQPPGHWMLHRGPFAGQESVTWIALGATKAAPGASTPPLDVGAVGIPGVVSYYTIADTPPPRTTDPDGEEPSDQMLQRSLSGTTVGIVRVPAAATPTTLTARLRNLLTQACNELQWVGPGAPVAASLRVAYTPATANGARRTLTSSAAAAARAPLPASCQGPDASLAAAHRALVAGATATARDQLTAFVQQLDGLRANGQINGAGYGLLAGNATYLLNHM